MLPAERRVQRGAGKGIGGRTDPSFSVLTAVVGKHLCELPVVKREAENKAKKPLPQKKGSGECPVICCSTCLKLEAFGALQSTAKGVFVQKILCFTPTCTWKESEEEKVVAKGGSSSPTTSVQGSRGARLGLLLLCSFQPCAGPSW